MKQRIIFTGAGNSFVDALALEFEKSGHAVSLEDGACDVFVYCIDPVQCSATDYDGLLEAYESTAMGLLREVSEKLPLLEKGNKKRICFLTRLQSSINYAKDCSHWERIVAAACNMAIKTLFNRLSPMGYTFRLFGTERFAPEDASYAAEYFLQDRSLEDESDQHSDEKRLVIRDKYEREYPW